MMLALGYLISFVTGYCLISLVLRRHYRLNLILHLALALLLGLGVNATLTFYSIFLLNGFNAGAVLAINMLLLGVLITLVVYFHRRGEIDFSINERFHPLQLVGLLFWGLLAAILFLVATRFPYGDWDAWAIWNLKAKFLIGGGSHWRDIFSELSSHTHPDYPLLLPSMHAWILSFGAKNLYPIPMITANVLSILVVFLLYGALRQFNLNKRLCFVFSSLLFTHPFYSFLTSSQYADILLACLLLSSITLLILFLRDGKKEISLLTGLVMGLMMFTKNEGTVMALLLAIGAALVLWTNRALSMEGKLKLIKPWLVGFFLTASAVIILKLFLAPANDDIVGGFSLKNLVDIPADRYTILFDGLIRQFTDRKWCFVWLFLLIVYALGFKQLFKRENKALSFFVISYILVILGVYLYTQTNVDLKWWMDSSFRRILLTILPSLFLIGFYIHWGKNEHAQ